jgi:aryl-alcohol dehydrogenase-like predicted oxidoreductase
MDTRSIGINGQTVSALGLGCWAIGGKVGDPDGEWEWNGTRDDESIRAIRAALDAGVTLFDTADCYGAGHSERLLGEALALSRSRVAIATKFGNEFSEKERRFLGSTRADAAYIRRACEASLRRLKTDYIDLYQFHIWEYPVEGAEAMVEVLERLAEEGKIRAYGWSTDRLDAVKIFARGKHCRAAQLGLNLFEGNDELLRYCETVGLGVLCRSPLAMGLLGGKYDRKTVLPEGDIRTSNYEWISWFHDGKPDPAYLARLDAAKEILRSGGRTVAQGALAWIWAKSPATLPIPGFKSASQALENARALEAGPLTAAQAAEVERLVGRTDRYA